jgi:hypothetical protein
MPATAARRIHAVDRWLGSLADLPYPHAAENDVIVRVHAAGFTRGELAWEGGACAEFVPGSAV